ncbi:AbrB/MazE/SpoVT family DNA-binding domain-containing protein [Candidatus Poriferisodalis sp.]|uniref:AbrB/MazE/SpoVT family DNA-binding domain-containing protein n=1 Tax=Candidatus Poriferisodalis sp. TaxID=3101277 RepID=UPI003C6FE167
MSDAYHLVMGDRGRVVFPAEIRARAGMETGTPLILFEAEHGYELYTREQLSEKICSNLAGADLVNELLVERRQEAARENAEMERWMAENASQPPASAADDAA